MTTLYLGAKQGVAVLRQHDGTWRATLSMDCAQSPAVAVDPLEPQRAYATTFGAGVWRTGDGGVRWEAAGEGVQEELIWSIAVSAGERSRGLGAVYVGTEMSALYRSEDGGRTWVPKPSLQDLPSKPRWSYPPKPDTHHVRCILCDPNRPGLVVLGIEQGGVMRSEDGGDSFTDHNPQAQIDPHTLAAHAAAPGRVYEAAGGGYAESGDWGKSWEGQDQGLRHHYLYGMAVDPGDPDTIVISASENYLKAHNPHDSEATVYRRTGGGEWTEVRAGLPAPAGNQTYLLGAPAAEPGVFYLSTVWGDVYRSQDGGATWERLPIEWPEGLRLQAVRCVVPAAV